MTYRPLPAICLLTVVAASCSRSPQTTSNVVPTAPSLLSEATPDGRGVLRTAVVAFPARPDGLDFRAQLENKYRSLGRTPSEVYVDQEGDVVWVGEYYRYRVNGCDHDTAMQYVKLQIDTGIAPPICALGFFPENAIYPPREQSVDFRRQLGRKYQAMGRSSQSAVDADGVGIWMAEYFRYSTSGCDHATAVQKVLTQVDGNPAPETCLNQCVYRVPSSASVDAAGGTFTGQPERTSGACEWLAESEVPWINLSRPVTGGNRSPLTFTVQPNAGGPRRGSIRISYAGGQTSLEVDQASASQSVAFNFFDPARSTTPVTECQIRSAATICTLNPVANLPTVIVNYDWRVEYAYDGSKVKTQVGPLSSMSFTESCGLLGNNVAVPISVRVIATDAAGNTATIYSGQGSQPALQLRAFSCP
jgi:hypothetical protein